MKTNNLGMGAIISIILMIAITIAIAATVWVHLDTFFGKERTYTDDTTIISFAKTIDVGMNETGNITLSYSHFATKHDNSWYSITIYLNNINEPWKDHWYGNLWFKMDGSNYLEQNP